MLYTSYINKKKKGQALLTVLVVVSVLIILAAALADAAFIDYTSTLSDKNYSYSYSAGESAVEMCFDRLNQLCSNESMASAKGIYFTNKDTFSQRIIDSINRSELRDMRATDIFKSIYISGDINSSATTESLYLQIAGTPRYVSPYVYIPVGLTVVVSYKTPLRNTETSSVYASKEIRVYASEPFKLRSAVYTIGDLVTSPSSITEILGDVFVYGTSPYSMTSKQEYYGGIYAKTDSKLDIKGNAYCRSFIRTDGLGVGNALNQDNIRIEKDAFAQGIQVFSNNSKIVVYRDAYTFDDMEMNGENSVIAVNGNYFGLSKGGTFHDDSSAIVNSASIYNETDGAMKSRIVVNGNVLINGGTFKYDPDSDPIVTYGQTEDASAAWIVTTPSGILEKPLYSEWKLNPLDDPYHIWLDSQGYGYSDTTRDQINGFANLFQVWLPYQPNIDTWLTSIDSVRNAGKNNFGSLSVPSVIRGFGHYEMSANDRMYYSVNGRSVLDETSAEVKRASGLTGNFKLDLFNYDQVVSSSGVSVVTLENPSDISTYWKNYWNKCVDALSWKDDPAENYLTSVSDTLTNLLKTLKDKSPFLIRKEYDETASSYTEIKHKSNNQFLQLKNSLEQIGKDNSTNKNIFSNNADAGSNASNRIPTGTGPGEWSIPNLASADATKLSLLVNTDPERTIVLDGTNTTFRGIIFTTGKVVFRNGARLKGAVIAAGQGFSSTSPTYIEGSAADIESTDSSGQVYLRAPRILSNGANENVFKTGGYAAILFEGGSDTNKNCIDFPGDSGLTDPEEIRTYYINAFQSQHSINLTGIF